jgi:hypothetical protein
MENAAQRVRPQMRKYGARDNRSARVSLFIIECVSTSLNLACERLDCTMAGGGGEESICGPSHASQLTY